MEGGHGGLMVREGPCRQHLRLLSDGAGAMMNCLTGLEFLYVFSLLVVNFFRFFSDFYRQVATLYMHCI